MSCAATATVVVVSRDRWSLALPTLDLLLARTDPRHPVVVVDGRAPRGVAAVFDRWAASGRIRVARRAHHLAGNAARNLGADGVRTEWIAVVENDVVLSPGWLDDLLDVAEVHDAASAYPAYLVPAADGPVVHGLGADLHVIGDPGFLRLREQQHHVGRPWREIAGTLEPVARVQAEPHALVIRRDVLEQMGGFDEGLLSWFDHTDLALRHRRIGASAWCVPSVTCLYLAPPPVALPDVPGFLLRWSEDWYQRSLRHLCEVWGLDRDDSGWNGHAEYRTSVRRRVPTRWRRVNAALDHAVAPAERFTGWWNDRER